MMDIARITAVLALILVTILGMTAVFRFSPSGDRSISYAIATRQSFFIFAGLSIVILAGMLWYGIQFWYIPYYRLGSSADYMNCLMIVAAVGLAIIPADSDKSQKLHNLHFLFGQLLGVALIGLLATTALEAHGLNAVTRTLIWVTVSFCAICYPLYFFGRQRLKRWFLTFEFIFTGLLIVTLLVLTVG